MANSQQQQPPEDDSYKMSLGAAGVIGGAKLTSDSVPRILGRQNVYHGTGVSNVDSIKETGLQSRFGGTDKGTARFSEEYKNSSKGKVHVTNKRSVAVMNANYAGMTADQASHIAKNPELQVMNSMLLNKKDGHLFNVNMDYDKWRQMEIDPDTTVGHTFLGHAPETLEGIDDSKNLLDMGYNNMARANAVRGDINIEPHELRGNGIDNLAERYKQTAKNLPGYIKKYPGRFVGGLGGLAAGGAAMNMGVKQFIPQEKEANAMEYGLLKIAANYERSEQVRGLLSEQGRPLDAQRYGDYIDGQVEEGAMTGGLLGAGIGAVGGTVGSGMIHDRKVRNLENQGIRDQAEGLLAKANLERSYEGAMSGQNDWGEYNANYDRHNELESALKNNSKELEALKMRGVNGGQVVDGLKHGNGDNLIHLLNRYHPGIKGAALGGVIGAGTLGAAAGAIATREGAPEMGMEDHEAVRDVAPLGETVGTLAGGVAGAVGASHLPSKYRLPFSSLLGASVGMYGGRQAGKAIQNHMRDEE